MCWIEGYGSRVLDDRFVDAPHRRECVGEEALCINERGAQRKRFFQALDGFLRAVEQAQGLAAV